jgi:hypothetical protein
MGETGMTGMQEMEKGPLCGTGGQRHIGGDRAWEGRARREGGRINHPGNCRGCPEKARRTLTTILAPHRARAPAMAAAAARAERGGGERKELSLI